VIALSPNVVIVAASYRSRIDFRGTLTPIHGPSDVTVDRLVVTLAAMTGIAPTNAESRAATTLAAGGGIPADTVERSTLPIGYREAVALAERRGVEPAGARAGIDGLDEMIAERNLQVGTVGQSPESIPESVSYRLGYVPAGPIRPVVRSIRKGLRK
jgi:hypothetical protein